MADVAFEVLASLVGADVDFLAFEVASDFANNLGSRERRLTHGGARVNAADHENPIELDRRAWFGLAKVEHDDLTLFHQVLSASIVNDGVHFALY